MTIRETLKWGLFFMLSWLLIMLVNIQVHEVGHAIAMTIGGWKHQLVYFGFASPTDSALIETAGNWYYNNQVNPELISDTETVELFKHLNATLLPMRWGVMGGWLGQLVMTLFLLIMVKTPAFREGASSFGRLFAHGYIIINITWMGGQWFLTGLRPPTSSDPITLIYVILNENRLAIALLWLAALGLIGLGIWLGKYLGGDMLAGFGFSAEQGQQLAMFWGLATAVASSILKVPLGLPLIVSTILLIIAIVPALLLRRMRTSNVHNKQHIPGIVWQNALIALALIFAIIFTNSGFFVNGNTLVTEQIKPLMYKYCVETRCLPEELAVFYP